MRPHIYSLLIITCSVACNSSLPAPQADAGVDQAGPDTWKDPVDQRAYELPVERYADAAVDAEWCRCKRDGVVCGSGEECLSSTCRSGLCVRRENGESCEKDDSCKSGLCDPATKVCAWPACPRACQAHPDGGPECVSTCATGLICCPGGCRTPVDGGLPGGDGCV